MFVFCPRLHFITFAHRPPTARNTGTFAQRPPTALNTSTFAHRPPTTRNTGTFAHRPPTACNTLSYLPTNPPINVTHAIVTHAHRPTT